MGMVLIFALAGQWLAGMLAVRASKGCRGMLVAHVVTVLALLIWWVWALVNWSLVFDRSVFDPPFVAGLMVVSYLVVLGVEVRLFSGPTTRQEP